jgi:hypothetical protein
MKGDDIALRLLRFAVRVLKLVKSLPRDTPSRHVGRQFVRAARRLRGCDRSAVTSRCASFSVRIPVAYSIFNLERSTRPQKAGLGKVVLNDVGRATR